MKILIPDHCFCLISVKFWYYLFLAAVISSSRDSTSCDDRLVLIYWPTFQVFTLLQATSDPSITSPVVMYYTLGQFCKTALENVVHHFQAFNGTIFLNLYDGNFLEAI